MEPISVKESLQLKGDDKVEFLTKVLQKSNVKFLNKNCMQDSFSVMRYNANLKICFELADHNLSMKEISSCTGKFDGRHEPVKCYSGSILTRFAEEFAQNVNKAQDYLKNNLDKELLIFKAEQKKKRLLSIEAEKKRLSMIERDKQLAIETENKRLSEIKKNKMLAIKAKESKIQQCKLLNNKIDKASGTELIYLYSKLSKYGCE